MDTDSPTIGIDNQCSLCNSHIAEDFVGELRDSNQEIRGFGRVIQPKIKTGTLLWQCEDDQGQEHKFLIPNSLFIPSGKCRLFSPQHWAQTQKDEQKLSTKTTDRSKVVLTWGNKSKHYQRTVPLSKKDNVATFYLSPGFNKFHLFCQQAMDDPLDDDAFAVAPSMINENEEHNIPLHTSSNTNLIRSWTPFTSDPHLPQPIPSQARPEGDLDNDPEKADTEGEQEGAPITGIDAPRSVSFEEPSDNFALPTTNQPADLLSQSEATDAAMLLRYHYCYGHISFRRLKKMAEQGVFPQHLKNIPTPACLACYYAKATERPWRHKPQKHYTPPPPPTTPGQVLSVDQLVSPTPGLIAQMTGKLTTKRYKYATVFVDHFSRFSYV